MSKSTRVGPEIVLGIVRPVGVPGKRVRETVEAELRRLDYDVVTIQLSQLLGVQTSRREDERILALIDAANEYCSNRKDSSAMALLALEEIRAKRVERRRESDDQTDEAQLAKTPLVRTAYILDSLKRPAEVTRLRTVYGERFFLISIQMDRNDRRSTLREQIRPSALGTRPESLDSAVAAVLDRDESEPDDYGQAVIKTFPMADVFINFAQLESDFRRFLNLLFNNPRYEAPTTQEFAMHIASVSSTRSTAMGRKVGAAIVDRDESIIATGYNEVPIDSPTDTDIGYDSSQIDVNDLTIRTLRYLKDKGFLSDKAASLLEGDLDDLLRSDLAATPISDIIEYQRPVHAEMNALIDAARRGIPLADCSIYVTSYPCHLCAKHLLALRMKPVIYVEPYPKSRAQAMYGETVKEGFMAFTGVAPRRYGLLFDVGPDDRKSFRGEISDWSPRKALPKVGVFDDGSSVTLREVAALGLANEE